MSQPDRPFLDANVLFSAAYRKDSGVRELWELSGAVLLSSTYAAAEARRNLSKSEQHEELEALLASVELYDFFRNLAEHPEVEQAGLPEKDLPILRAALGAGATHLITGDRKHFGHLFGREVAGVLVLRPADYLRPAR